MDKQLSNKTELIRFLAYLTTWQISCPSSLPQKTSCGNQARDKGFSLMQLREKEKARNFFGKQFYPWPFVCDCFASSTAHSSWGRPMLFSVGVVLALKCRIHLQSSTSSSCLVAAAWQQLHLPHRVQYWVKSQCWAGWYILLHWKSNGDGAKKQSLHDDTQ